MRINITSDMHATADVLDNIAEWADVKDKERYIALANS